MSSKPQTVAAGWHGEVVFTVLGECGISGAVGWSVSISPAETYPNGITLHQPTYHPLVISSTHPNASDGFEVLTSPSTVKTTYTITFKVGVDGVTHTTESMVTVNGYSITVNPSSVSGALNKAVYSTITLQSFGGYSATIQFSISISPDTGFGTDSCFNPTGDSSISSASPTATSQWTCTITPAGSYIVTITAMPLSGAPDLSASVSYTVTTK